MSLIHEILAYNRRFVANNEFEKFQSSKFPEKKIVVLSCMDTRLMELLPRAMNFKNGDVKMIKNAGAIISHPFDSIMRSIVVAIYELNAEEICIIGHYGCGMASLNTTHMMYKFIENDIDEKTLAVLEHSGIDIENWLKGFTDPKENIINSVNIVKNHPLIPKSVLVHGLIIDPVTGKLDPLAIENKK